MRTDWITDGWNEMLVVYAAFGVVALLLASVALWAIRARASSPRVEPTARIIPNDAARPGDIA